MNVGGSHSVVVKEKIRLLRDMLKWWNKKVFGWVDLRIEEADIELNDCDEKMEIDALDVSGNWVKLRSDASHSFWKNLQYRENILRQKNPDIVGREKGILIQDSSILPQNQERGGTVCYE